MIPASYTTWYTCRKIFINVTFLFFFLDIPPPLRCCKMLHELCRHGRWYSVVINLALVFPYLLKSLCWTMSISGHGLKGINHLLYFVCTVAFSQVQPPAPAETWVFPQDKIRKGAKLGLGKEQLVRVRPRVSPCWQDKHGYNTNVVARDLAPGLGQWLQKRWLGQLSPCSQLGSFGYRARHRM